MNINLLYDSQKIVKRATNAGSAPAAFLITLFLIVMLPAASFAGGGDAAAPETALQQRGAGEQQKTVEEITAGTEAFPGFFTFYWDSTAGKIWLEIGEWESEFLYVNSLPAGVGSNDIGLDRGQLGREKVVYFQRSGPRVLLIQPNYSYRAESDNPDERRAVRDSFAQSAIWGFEVAAEENGRVLVDATAFLLRDAHDVAGVLKRAGQGEYRLEPSRSAFFLSKTKSFPRNTEFEAMLTFVGSSPGADVRQVVPSPKSVTVRQHHSFIRLPDDGYTPRPFDPRAGFSGISYMDFAAPLGQPVVKRFISRHRLHKRNPEAAISEPVVPIVYHVDRGAPEPVRSALIEGASWWNQAFEAAGYKDAFQVELMPEGADPMDVRYNVIQWVHRATRGWSYGGSIVDPRTGEIIKGHVTLGSLRVRQDYLLAQALLAPYEKGKPESPAMRVMALARIRQLSAHEVGHTIGLAHNFAASVDGRASVMDYPHPLVRIGEDGSLDLSEAYAVGIGEWDKVTVAYGYQDFPKGTDEEGVLRAVLEDAISRGLHFISDQDARPPGGAHPIAHLWDNGTDAVAELERIMRVRALALSRFSENAIREGQPLATLEEVLVPLYMFHRYQVEAAVKVLGGLDYNYALRGDGQMATRMIPADLQHKALDVILATIRPEALEIPERILELIPPRPIGYPRTRETFHRRTGVTFDPLAAAEAAADQTVRLILHPQRAARLVEHHARDAGFPGLPEVIDRLLAATWGPAPASGYQAEIHRVVNYVVLYNLMSLAAEQSAPPQVRAVAYSKLDDLKILLAGRLESAEDPDLVAHYRYAVALIDKFQENPEQIPLTKPTGPPPGAPIGDLQTCLER